MTAEQLKKHIDDNYGYCALDIGEKASPNCQCLKQGVWLGTDCDKWKPTGSSNWSELAAYNRRQRETEKASQNIESIDKE